MGLFERSVLGLDVGSHDLKAVELKVSPRSLDPGQFRVHPRVDAGTPLSEHIQRFLAMHNLPTDQVACALPARQLSTRRLEFPFSDQRRLAQAIPFEIEAETPFDLDDIFIDWNLLAGDRTHGVVAATLVQRDRVAEYLELLQESGCDPHVLEGEGLVLANLAPVFGLEGTQLIADIGHEKTTFCALLNGRPVLARSIPVAGRAITEAIASEQGLSFEEAEQRKCERGVLDRPDGVASPGALAVLDRIAREAVRTLEAAEARHGEGPVAREAILTLIGGSARLDRIDDLLAKRTGLETHRLRMPADSPHAALVEGIDPVLFGPALALALRLSGESVTKMNFRQGEFAFRQDLSQLFNRELRPTAILAGVLLLLMIVSTATSIFLQHRRAGRYQAAIAQLYSEAFPDRSEIPSDPVSALGRELRGAQSRADFLGLYSGNRSALELLAELSRAIPSDLDVRITEVSIDRNVIRLDVEAAGYEAADRLTGVLSEVDPFQGAKVSGSIKTDQRSGGVSFNVSIPLLGEGEEA
ncbi:MAG: pilus assembly protein PilM [Deltaproteobacteria bacterium]|jgi:general secretion pathway protein L|nr:pilus assembly protein PilM [Deltaproteobacteria bacterium]